MDDEDVFGLRSTCEKFVNELMIPETMTLDEQAEFALQEFKYALRKSASHLFVSLVDEPSTKGSAGKSTRKPNS
jgi:hypothetical protein